MEFEKRGVQSTVFVVGSRPVSKTEGSEKQFRIVRIDGRLHEYFSNSAKLLSAILANSVDVVHVFTGASTLFGASCLFFGRLFRIPSAMSIFGREDVTSPSVVSRATFLISASLATSISTNSRATRDLLPVRFLDKTHVLLGGSETARPAAVEPAPKSCVLFVGRLVERKGIDDLLVAFALIRSKIPRASLTIVGEGSERKALEQKTEELGLSSSVRFTGALQGDALQAEYDSCEVFVLPSKTVKEDSANEGLGLVLIEAAMHGKPLVGTKHGGIPEVIENGVNGLLVPENCPNDLANAVLSLLQDEDLAKSMGENARRVAHSRFTWQSATQRLLNSYQ